MTTTPARRTSPSDARPAPGRVIVALAAVLAVMAVGIITLFAGPASASPLAGAQNAVGVIAHGAGQRVGPHESIPAGQGRARAPNYDQTVVGSGVGAETAAGGGDHIVLGLKNFGLEDTAAKVGGRTLLNDPEWMSTLQQGIADTFTKFTVSLDGLSGNGTYGQIMSAVQRGAAGTGGYTDWEMAQLYQGGRLPGVTFVRGGQVVENPFGP